MTLAPADLPYVNIGTGSQVFDSNVYTFLIYPLLDFGTFGLMVFMAVLGALIAFAFWNAEGAGLRYWVPTAALGLTLVSMSFFSLSILSDAQYLFLALLSFCFVPKTIRAERGTAMRRGAGNAKGVTSLAGERTP